MLGLQLLSSDNRPTGYLHSWNQISTLSTARAIAENSTPWLRPVDVVTRLSWLPSEGEKEFIESGDAFVAYEEFPLYHIALSHISKLGLSLEQAGHGLSISMFLLTLLGFSRLLKSSTEKAIALFIFATSSPLVYYGQAIMSDMSMLCCVVWFFTFRANSKDSRTNDIISCVILAIGGLFKSYAIIFSLVFFLEHAKRITVQKALRALLLCFFCCAPVLYWHYFSSQQIGHQEAISHSLIAKADVLLSIELYKTFAQMLFRYLGYLPATILLIVLLILLLRRIGLIGESIDWLNLAWFDDRQWIAQWLICGSVFLLATTDKLLHHDYYYLLLAPPVIILAARALLILESWCFERAGLRVAGSILIIFALSNIGFSVKHVRKATRINPDVDQCAELLRTNSEPNALFGVLSDVSRFNSIAYYGRRNGITIENDSIQLERYQRLGMRYLLINLDPEGAAHYASWIEGQNSGMTLLDSLVLKDFKKRDRICNLYGASMSSS
jgi:hypothetical protein